MSFLTDVIKSPSILKPKKHIILLSHMRAYTSLFGHILGNHDEIEGYYEMHIGYYGWKSFYRQKQLFYKEHKPKAGAKYMFDKVLHNEHSVALELLKQDNVVPIISLREPISTIPSIIKHYQKVRPDSEYNNVDFAANYYIERVNALANLATKLSNGFIYVDASSIVKDPDFTLTQLKSFLDLSSPISQSYQQFEKSAKGNFGDHSRELKSGRIEAKKMADNDIEVSDEIMDKAKKAYINARSKCIENTSRKIIIDDHE